MNKKIETKIVWRGRFHNIDFNKPPKDERQLLGFLSANNAPKCFVKSDNYWRKVTREGNLLRVVRTLYLLSFKEWLEISMNDNFTANI